MENDSFINIASENIQILLYKVQPSSAEQLYQLLNERFKAKENESNMSNQIAETPMLIELNLEVAQKLME
mgnify:CR=1 FL=1